MRLVIFDVDGTLVDSAAIIMRAQVDTFARHGLVHPGRAAGLGVIGLSLNIALMQLAGFDEPDEALTQTYRDVFNTLRTNVESTPELAEPLYPGAADVLASLGQQQQTRLAIATGKSRRGADYMLDMHGWHRVFSSIQTADDAPSKPHPGMIERAMAETGVGPDRTVMIGDSTFDMEMAVAAGTMAIGVSWGFQPVERLLASGAHHIVQGYADVPDLIDRILPVT
jgi:phosphoglycolate phosphatase